MQNRLVAVAAIVAALTAATVGGARPACAATGLHVNGADVVEGNGRVFVMRGVNHAYTWSGDTSAFAAIKALGANTVRVVLSGGRWPANGVADVANVVGQCRRNRLVCVLEDHDTTGHGELRGAVTLDAAVNYWISVRSALAGQERFIVINIGNEPYANDGDNAAWPAATASAIRRMRGAGFQHLLMVDAPNWGQDWKSIMRDNARAVFASDPARNTVFSVHMYGHYDSRPVVSDYLDRFRAARLPLVIGEFGDNHSDGNPDEDAIMSAARTRGFGYLGWSWRGNGGDVAYLDMVTGSGQPQLTAWGRRIFNGADGIRSTSREASVYGARGRHAAVPPADATSARHR